MTDETEMRHKLRNMEQEKLALKGLLNKAANELDDLSHSDCSAEAKFSAERTAQKLRRAAGA